MMLCIMLDHVSGQFGQPFHCPNPSTLNRDLLQMISNPDIPDQFIHDTVVLALGEFNMDPVNPTYNLYSVPKTIWRGDSPDVSEFRSRLAASCDSEDC